MQIPNEKVELFLNQCIYQCDILIIVPSTMFYVICLCLYLRVCLLIFNVLLDRGIAKNTLVVTGPPRLNILKLISQ